MPHNLSRAVPVGVFPQYTYLAFNESRIYPLLTATYHDATSERSLITDTVNFPVSIHNFKLTVRLSTTQWLDLKTFYESHQGSVIPFYFYNPFEAAPGMPVGSNWSATASTFEGLYSVRFNNPMWNEVSDLSRTNVSLELQEVA